MGQMTGGAVSMLPRAAAATVAASTMAPGLRGSAADAVSPENEVPLRDQQLERVAEEVEKIRDNDDTVTDLEGKAQSREG